MAIWGIILAGGSGSRIAAQAGIRKQFLTWKGRPLYWHSALAMSRCALIAGLIFVLPKDVLEAETARIRELSLADQTGLAWRAIAGGSSRQESSAAGIAALPEECDKVLVHDAARCFASPALFRAVCESIGPDCPAVIPALPVTDTIKLASPADICKVERTLPRERLYAVQTPQGFMVDCLKKALAGHGTAPVTDDASIMEQAGYPVLIIPGETTNAKITRPEDLGFLEEEARNLKQCTGFGYDAHRFGPGRPLKLGGIAIPGGQEVVAHSDGDVLLHSLMDALLGAASLGDIGCHFPDSDPAYAGISSALLLDHVLELLADRQISIGHVDLTVVAQKPKLAPYAAQIRKNVARLLGLPLEMVNFKATTEEKMGFTGRLEGIKAYAVADVTRKP